MSPEPSAAATLGWIARAKGIAHKLGLGAGLDWLVANGAPERAQRIIKAPIGAGSTADARIDVRWGAVDGDNSRRYAAELVALAPNVILASACFWPNPASGWRPLRALLGGEKPSSV